MRQWPSDVGTTRNRIIRRVRHMPDRRPVRLQRNEIGRSFCDRVSYGRYGTQICDHSRQVIVREVTVERDGHRWADDRAVWPPPLADRGSDLVVLPAANPGL